MSQKPWIRITGHPLADPEQTTYSVQRRGRDVAEMLAAEVDRFARNRYRQPLAALDFRSGQDAGVHWLELSGRRIRFEAVRT